MGTRHNSSAATLCVKIVDADGTGRVEMDFACEYPSYLADFEVVERLRPMRTKIAADLQHVTILLKTGVITEGQFNDERKRLEFEDDTLANAIRVIEEIDDRIDNAIWEENMGEDL